MKRLMRYLAWRWVTVLGEGDDMAYSNGRLHSEVVCFGTFWTRFPATCHLGVNRHSVQCGMVVALAERKA